MRVCLMIEGQEDVSWNQWVTIARNCESFGLEGLFRSDHYASVEGARDRGSLDAWVTLAGLAARTQRIRLGTLVSPVTFRHPSVLAKAVTTVDHISSGRAELGMGAGWLEAEHRAYGFPFPDDVARMRLLEEQVEIVHRQWTEARFSFEGDGYRLEDVSAVPRPIQEPHPPLILGGAGGPRSLRLAARWANEYNTVSASADECRMLKGRLDEACERAGRDPATLTFSLMTGCVVGSTHDDVLRRARSIMNRTAATGDAEAWVRGQNDRWVVGTATRVAERLQELEDAGVQRVMLQHRLHEDAETISILGQQVALLSSRDDGRLLLPEKEA
jgi:F420-dependent oxidoreductase-like protein